MSKRQRNVYFGQGVNEDRAWSYLLSLEESGINLSDLAKVVLLQLRDGSLSLEFDPLRIASAGAVGNVDIAALANQLKSLLGQEMDSGRQSDRGDSHIEDAFMGFDD